jgi:hypothetical protein
MSRPSRATPGKPSSSAAPPAPGTLPPPPASLRHLVHPPREPVVINTSGPADANALMTVDKSDPGVSGKVIGGWTSSTYQFDCECYAISACSPTPPPIAAPL